MLLVEVQIGTAFLEDILAKNITILNMYVLFDTEMPLIETSLTDFFAQSYKVICKNCLLDIAYNLNVS